MIIFNAVIKPILLFLFFGAFQRLILFAVCHHVFTGYSSLVSGIFIGLIYDLSFISFVLISFFLLCRVIDQKKLNGFYVFILLIWALLNSLDIFSFYYTRTRLSLVSFNLFGTGDLLSNTFDSGITLFFVLAIITSVSLILIARKRFFIQIPQLPIKKTLLYCFIFSIPTLVYLPYPINFYTDQFPVSAESKQLASNPFYSWGSSMINRTEKDIMDKDLALSAFRKKYNYTGKGADLLSREVNYADSSYNSIILVVMESFGANRIGALNGEKWLSPNFDSLCKDGTLYTKCFACGPRTQYGITSLIFGFPHILEYNIFRQNKLKLPFEGMPQLLRKRGYISHFFHGGRTGYDDMDLFLESGGVTHIKDMNDINPFAFKNSWGVDDEALYTTAAKDIETTKKNFYLVLSMSNHEPFEVPNNFNFPKELSPSERTFLYSDLALGKFIDQLKTQKKYDNSLIIITGDHGEFYNDKDNETKLVHVPLLIIDHKQKNKQINTPCSHAEVAEFILSRSGYKGPSHLIGKGVLQNVSPNVYYRNYTNDIYKVTDTCVYRYNIFKKQLARINCENNMYVRSIKKLDTAANENKAIISDISVYYTSLKFIFETGLYRPKN